MSASLYDKPIIDANPRLCAPPLAQDRPDMGLRCRGIGEAALLALSLVADPAPARLHDPLAKQVGCHPDAVIAGNIVIRIDRAQMDEAGDGRLVHGVENRPPVTACLMTHMNR